VAFLGPKVAGFLSITFFKNFLKINGLQIRAQHILEHHKTYFSRGRIFDTFLDKNFAEKIDQISKNHNFFKTNHF